MADAIDILLGGGLDPATSTKSLAEALRGQQNYGDFLSMSQIPQLAQQGQANRRQATAGASRGGRLKEAAARRMARTEERKADRAQRVADRAEDRALRKAIAASRAGRGGGGGRGRAYKGPEVLGVPTMNRGGMLYIAGTDIRATPENAKKFLGGELEATSADRQAKASGTSRSKRADAMNEELGTLRSITTEYRNVAGALDEGAQTGPIAGSLPEWTNLRAPTRKLYNARDKLAALDLGRYKLSPLSDKDVRWVKGFTLDPKLDEEVLKPLVAKRMEGLERIIAANEYKAETLRAGEEFDPAQVTEILYGGGFTFDDPPVGEASQADDQELNDALNKYLPNG